MGSSRCAVARRRSLGKPSLRSPRNRGVTRGRRRARSGLARCSPRRPVARRRTRSATAASAPTRSASRRGATGSPSPGTTRATATPRSTFGRSTPTAARRARAAPHDDGGGVVRGRHRAAGGCVRDRVVREGARRGACARSSACGSATARRSGARRSPWAPARAAIPSCAASATRCFARGSRPTATAASPSGAAGGSVDGQPRGAPVRLGAAGETTWNLNAAIAPTGEAWVVFDAQAGHARRGAVRCDARRRPRHAGAADGRRRHSLEVSRSRARGDGRGAITWFDERDGNREVYLAAARRRASCCCRSRRARAESRRRRARRSAHTSLGTATASGSRGPTTAAATTKCSFSRSMPTAIRWRRRAGSAIRRRDSMIPGDRALARRLRVGMGRGGARAPRSG